MSMNAAVCSTLVGIASSVAASPLSREEESVAGVAGGPLSSGRGPSTVAEALVRVEDMMGELIGAPEADHCAEMAQDHLRSGGKRLRARLALEVMAALGADPAAAVGWAAACELMHNASLIHDDLQDEDAVRRGRPAVWKRYGKGQAINAGDLLLMLPFTAAGRSQVSDAMRWRLAECLARHGARTARGQADEMALRGDLHMERAAYMQAAEGKTSGLFGMPVEGAALLARRRPERAAQLARPFEQLGLLYQLQDDVIDLFGDKGREARGADLREGKVSALVVAHIQLHPGDRLWLARVLRTPRSETGQREVEETTARFAEGGALALTLSWIDQLASAIHGPELRREPALRRVAEQLRDRFLHPLTEIRPLARGQSELRAPREG